MGHVGYQSDVAGALDRRAQGPLVLGANAAASAGFDLGPVRHEAADFVDFLIVDVLDVFHAEGANAAARSEPAPGPAAGTPARSAAARTSSGPTLWSGPVAGWSWGIARRSWRIARWPGSFGGHLTVLFVIALDFGKLEGQLIYVVVARAAIPRGTSAGAVWVAAHTVTFAVTTAAQQLHISQVDV